MALERDYKEAAKVAAFQKRQGDHVHHQPLSVRARTRQRAAARMHSNLKPMRFASLHHHTTFSFLDGFQLPEAHVRRATELNMQAIGFTEHGNTFSHVKAEAAAEEAGIKPIFGCEFYTGWTDEERRTQRKNHLTVIAKNAKGYRNLMELVSQSWAQGFYHEPTVDPHWLVEKQEGLVVLSGCQGSALFTALVGGKHVEEKDASYKRGLRVARWFSERLDDYYIEVQAFPELERTNRANPLLARVARAIGRPLVATMDCHYTAPEEVEIQKILHNVRPGNKRTLEDQVRDWGYDAPLCPPATDRSVYRRLRGTGLTHEQAVEAVLSTEAIAQECDVQLPKLPMVEYPTKDPIELWRRWLKQGWRYRGIHRLAQADRNRYREQLRHEMELIEEKGYVGYFLIVADGVKAAKEHGIPVGPSRGSAAASLCCYLLRITEVDPLQFPELQFERFLDKTREDMPDIDLDFAPSGLPWLRNYYENKYGPECVSTVGTFTMYKPKASVTDVGRVFRIPKADVERVKELLLERSSGDLRASAGVQDTLDQFDEAAKVAEEYPQLQYAMDLEGNAKGFGTHAAGLVVANGPLTEVTSVLTKMVNNEVRQVVGMDKYDAARQGLMKLDFLSLATMEQIYAALRELDATVEDLYAIPLDDKKTLKGFQENDTVGIFQFDGRVSRFVNSVLKPTGFNHVAHLTTLVRPGPMLSGATRHYVDVKNGAEYEHVHPALAEVTHTTNYQVIFQEQILSIVRYIGGFDWTHRAHIRKIISKKRGEQEFNRERKRFIDGAAKLHDMDEETAQKVWDIVVTAGAYVFNAAHSYSYGMLAWWTMYLKRHHPTVFYATGLAHLPEGDNGVRHEALRRDAVHEKGIKLLPPDKRSGVTWRADRKRKALVAGWEQVPGIGPKTAEKLAEFSGTDLTLIPGVGPKTVDLISQFQQRHDPFGVESLERALQAVRALGATGVLPEPTHTLSEALVAPGGVPMVLAAVPTNRNLRELFEVHRARTGQDLDPATVKDPDKTEWVLMLVRDETEFNIVQFLFPRRIYPAFREAIWNVKLGHDVLVAAGKMLRRGNSQDSGGWGTGSGIFLVSKLWVVDPDEE